MDREKQTESRVAKEASKILNDNRSGKKVKSVAGSALSQTGSTKKSTSTKVAREASRILKDSHSSKQSKSVAGSTLSQRQEGHSNKITTKNVTHPPRRP